MALGTVAVVIALVTLYVAPRLQHDQIPTALSRQLTSGAGTETEPAISPDGRTVAYTSDESGNQDLWIVETRGGPPRRFTTNPAKDWRASWFPDGSALAFMSDRDGRTGIWKAPLFDGDAAVLLIAGGMDPAVSPDGSRIAFVTGESSGSRFRVAVAPLDDLDRVKILTSDRNGLWDHSTPTWSPDSRTLCYGAWDGLWLVPAAGGEPRHLTAVASDVEPVWSPGGSFIYFSSYRDGRAALWRVRAAGGAPTRVMPGSSAEHHPTLSGDGRLLAFSTSVHNRNLVVRDVATGQERPVTSGGDDTLPSFAPDGRSVYFVSDRWGRVDLWAQALGDKAVVGPPRPVTDREGIESNPACSPNGRWVAYYRLLNDRRDIWIAPASGGSPVRFTDVDATETHPAWAPDGYRLAFVSSRGGGEQIWVRPVRDGRIAGPPVAVTSGRARHQVPAWSPDGSRIAYLTAVGSDPLDVAIVAADGAETSQVLTSGAHAMRVRWNPASNLLFVSGTWDTGQWEVRTVDPRTGEVRKLAPPAVGDRELATFDVSRDGRLIVFSRNNARGNVWVLEAESRPF